MLIVRVFSALAKPALLSGAITASAAGGWFAYDRFSPHNPPSAFQQLQTQGQRLLISEFGDKTDVITAIDPADTTNGRAQIATIDHAAGWGVFPVLAPDARAIAYTALPADTLKPSAAAPAQAAIVGVGGDVAQLADDADLLVAPIWSPDSASIVVRKNTPSDDGAGTFELLLLGRDGSRATMTTWRSAAVFPIAFAPDGAKLYFAALSAAGTDLYSVAPDGSGETKIARLSDQVARDWKLSPDGATLAYSVAESGETPQVIARTLDIASGVVSDALVTSIESGPPTVAGARGELNPAWKTGGGLTVASVGIDGGGAAVDIDPSGNESALTSNGDSIDLPLAWSPDGTSLAVRAVDGKTPFDARASHIDLLRDGARQRVSDSADVLIVGWTR